MSGKSGTAAQKANSASATDKVVLSPKARELHEARVELAGIPDIDSGRVARIQHRIEKGTYEIDGGQIAEKMLGEMMRNSSP